MEFSCIVLAGGKGARFGQSKLLEKVSGKSLIQRVVNTLSSFQTEIIVVTGKDQLLPESTELKARIVHDLYPGAGPTGGIYTGLTASGSFYNLAVAGDMPFLNQKLLQYMIESSAGFDAVVPRFGDMLEPLHAIYSKNCLPYIKGQLEQDKLNIRNFFSQIRVRYIEAQEVEEFDPKHLSFFNVNTKADLSLAEELLKSTSGEQMEGGGKE